MKTKRGKPSARDVGATTRRDFLKAGALGAGAAIAGAAYATEVTPQIARPPNFLVIVSDQLGLDALAAHGCADVRTPNLDRLADGGVSFLESHSTDPVCSPARSSIFTGRMPTETGVITNGRPIHASVPNMGQWLHEAGYETVYCGKWHLPEGYATKMPGFTVLPVGGGQGDLIDGAVSRSCEAYLKNRSKDKPFLLAASFMQPHDICHWAIKGKELVPEEPAFPQIEGRLPELPPNHTARPRAPKELASRLYEGFSDAQWRYYLYIYYRQIEMLDAEVGRVLDALEDSGHADNTVILFTADHGDGRGRHMHVSKWYPYEEAVKVPFIVSCPGRVEAGVQDARHLVSGVDVMSTVCDYAGAAPPPEVLGRSVRPLLEGRATEWREFVVADVQVVGRMLRTAQYKYVRYQGDPVEQLFDMQADPWETANLYDQAQYGDVMARHRKLLDEWEGRLITVPPTEDHERRGRRRGKPRTRS